MVLQVCQRLPYGPFLESTYGTRLLIQTFVGYAFHGYDMDRMEIPHQPQGSGRWESTQYSNFGSKRTFRPFLPGELHRIHPQNSWSSHYLEVNTVNEAFCRYRHIFGLPTSVVNISPIEDIGFVAENGPAAKGLELQGLEAVSKGSSWTALSLAYYTVRFRNDSETSIMALVNDGWIILLSCLWVCKPAKLWMIHSAGRYSIAIGVW